MSSDEKKTLNDADITTSRPTGRRGFLGLMAAGGASGAALGLGPRPVSAQGTDGDNGAWNDAGGCGRGPGGTNTGLTDADTGSISDATGQGRGAPRC